MENFSFDELVNWGISYTPKVIGALLTLFIGFWISRFISSKVKKTIQNRTNDESVSSFFSSLVNVGLKILVLFIAAGIFGIETTSFVAILGALAFAIGMALQGSLGHFASGVLLLTFRPYKVNDLVDIGGGHVGTVLEIQIFNTILETLDNKRIIVPNGVVTSNVMINISGQGEIGVELEFGIGYNDSIDDARKIILEVGTNCPWVLKNPVQSVVVGSLGESSVNLNTRPFVKSEHYWDAYFYMQENVKKAFDKAGISIPYPQMDIHQFKGS